jgi:hypothetical protein
VCVALCAPQQKVEKKIDFPQQCARRWPERERRMEIKTANSACLRGIIHLWGLGALWCCVTVTFAKQRAGFIEQMILFLSPPPPLPGWEEVI